MARPEVTGKKLCTATAELTDHDELVPDPQVCRELHRSSMTLWRWDRDAGLHFPPPVKIRGRNYRSRRALEEFKQRMLREAVARLPDEGPAA
jgi:hypothetical protein